MTLQLDAATTALVLIDLQHGIVGMALQPRPGVAVVQACHGLADAFRRAGAMVVYVRVDLAAMTPLLVDVSHAGRGTPPPAASELVADAGLRPGDLLVTKHHWGAFGPGELDGALRAHGVATLVLAGIATNFGVESTARQAVSLGLNVVIASDACASIDSAAHDFALTTILPLISRVRTVAEIKGALA